MTDRCKTCGHPRHTHGRGPCGVKRVGGPPSAKGRKVGDGYDHVGRDVNHCDCTAFVTERNGVEVHP